MLCSSNVHETTLTIDQLLIIVGRCDAQGSLQKMQIIDVEINMLIGGRLKVRLRHKNNDVRDIYFM
jgi:hypothetical protein